MRDPLAARRTTAPPTPGIVPANYFRWKALLDRVLALVLLIPGVPMMIGLALLVKLTSRGPGIYRQLRVGRHGRNFVMYKIRTMASDAELTTGAVWSQRNDPRVTGLGRVLRKLHLDELPQLFNVLRGEMSLIGPRPERPEFTHRLALEVPGYLNRLAVLPGITGLAQINLPPDTDLNSVRLKLVLDLEYIERASLTLDLRMFVCTALRMFGLGGSTAMKLMLLEREATLADADAPADGPTDGATIIQDGVARLKAARLNGHPAANGTKRERTTQTRV